MKEKFRRLAEAHRDDDLEEAERLRAVSDQERARLFAGLCRLALAAEGAHPSEPEPRSPQAEAWWTELIRRKRARTHGRP